MRYEFNPKKVKGLAYENGMTQGDLANLLGLSQTGMSLKFNGKADFKAGEIAAIATRLKVTPEVFLHLLLIKLKQISKTK